MWTEQVEHADGRVELKAHEVSAADGRLFNEDLAPTTVAQRNWSTYNFAALWVSMAHCIPTYMMAAGMIEVGMNWRQALFTILLGNLIVLVPILLNSHPGTKYGIPFPVFARASYGVFGSNVPALMRAIVACGWFGIQCWIGGAALQACIEALWPAWGGLLGSHGSFHRTQWLSFLAFWGINIWIIYRGMDLLRKVENWAAPYVLVMTGLLVWWAVDKAHGLGPILSQPSRIQGAGAFVTTFLPKLTGVVAFWATLSLNMPDFTRYGRSQREQAVGQVVALPTTMTVFAAMGVVITSATKVIFGVEIWEPVSLVGRFPSAVVVAISTFTIVIATLAVNIAANVVSPANDFANAFPKWINFQRGGLLTGLLGIAMCPWKLLADASVYIDKWLVGYSGAMGPIAGVLITDYWLVKRRKLDLADLYRADGRYAYGAPAEGGRFRGRGVNWAALGATAAGCAAAWVGAFVPKLAGLYSYAWFVGAGVAAPVYAIAMRAAGDPSQREAGEVRAASGAGE